MVSKKYFTLLQMKKPLVSVLLPSYNAEKYIAEAIESILNQTYRNIEFIIVDDASTDNTWKIIKSYAKKDKRIIAYRNKANLRSCFNYIKAMKLAKGKYIAIMNNDDVSYSYRIEKQYKFLEKHPDVGIVGGVMKITDEKGNYIAKRKYHLTDDEIRKNIFRYSPFSHPTVMIRKSVLDKVGYYNPKYAPSDDYDLYFRIGKVSKFANLPNILLKYRVILNSMTNISTRRMELSTIAVRYTYGNNRPYKMTLIDKILTFIQYVTIFIVPSKIRLLLFNFLRNSL